LGKASAAAETLRRRLFGLDLVRAIAIVLVLQVHIGFYILPFYNEMLPWLLGDLGVELFFVLSGFLIGALVLEVSERTPTLHGWLRFMLRRWMRTVPLYVLWTLIVFALMKLAHRPFPLLAYLTFTQNIAWPMPSNSPFPVSWSLTVEEWFYLLFSATLIVSALVWSRRALLLTCALFILIPLVLRVCFDVVYVEEGPRTVAIFRLDAIAYGAMMVWVSRDFPQKMQRLCPALLATGLVLVVASVLFSDVIAPAFIFTFYPLGLALILPAISRVSSHSRVAEATIGWLSTRSYALYLTHLTIIDVGFSAVRTGHPTVGLLAVIPGVFVVADLLHRYIERPIMVLRPKQFPQPQATPRFYRLLPSRFRQPRPKLSKTLGAMSPAAGSGA
jgi:peptidoglycan/LPS O-acetylase OafA/YrhL